MKKLTFTVIWMFLTLILVTLFYWRHVVVAGKNETGFSFDIGDSNLISVQLDAYEGEITIAEDDGSVFTNSKGERITFENGAYRKLDPDEIWIIRDPNEGKP